MEFTEDTLSFGDILVEKITGIKGALYGIDIRRGYLDNPQDFYVHLVVPMTPRFAEFEGHCKKYIAHIDAIDFDRSYLRDDCPAIEFNTQYNLGDYLYNMWRPADKGYVSGIILKHTGKILYSLVQDKGVLDINQDVLLLREGTPNFFESKRPVGGMGFANNL